MDDPARRRNPLNKRVDLRTVIHLGPRDNPIRTETLDLGLGGAQCLSPQMLPIGSCHPCRVQIRDGQRKFWVVVEAEVVRSQFRPNGYKIGLKFTRTSAEIRAAIKKYLDQVEQAGKDRSS